MWSGSIFPPSKKVISSWVLLQNLVSAGVGAGLSDGVSVSVVVSVIACENMSDGVRGEC